MSPAIPSRAGMPEIPIDLSGPQVKLLRALAKPGGGVVDRYGRIIVQGEIVCRQTEAALALRLVAKGYIEGHDDHLHATDKGDRAIVNAMGEGS